MVRTNGSAVASQGKLTDAERHATEHIGAQMHPKFYEKTLMPTSIKELEFARPPFYEIAKLFHLKEGESA